MTRNDMDNFVRNKMTNAIVLSRLFDFNTVLNMLADRLNAQYSETTLIEGKIRQEFVNIINSTGIDCDLFRRKNFSGVEDVFTVAQGHEIQLSMNKPAKNVQPKSFVIPELSVHFFVDVLFKAHVYRKEYKGKKKNEEYRDWKGYDDCSKNIYPPDKMAVGEVISGISNCLVYLGYDWGVIEDEYIPSMEMKMIGRTLPREYKTKDDIFSEDSIKILKEIYGDEWDDIEFKKCNCCLPCQYWKGDRRAKRTDDDTIQVECDNESTEGECQIRVKKKENADAKEREKINVMVKASHRRCVEFKIWEELL